MKPDKEPGEGKLDPEDVYERVYSYRPHGVSTEEWDVIGPLVQSALLLFPYNSMARLNQETSTMSHFAIWCYRQGIPPDWEAMLVPELAWEYLRVHWKDISQRRAVFTKWGRQLTRDVPWPPPRKKSTFVPTRFDPLTPDEERLVWKLAREQDTPKRFRTAIALVGLGLGAGLDGEEILWAQAKDVSRIDEVVLVATGGKRARVIPMRSPYAEAIWELAVSCDPEEYLHGRRPYTWQSAHQLSNSLQGVLAHRIPKIEAKRLRYTYLKALLDAGIPFGDFLRAAGTTPSTALDAAPHHLKQSNDSDYRQILSRIPCEGGQP